MLLTLLLLFEDSKRIQRLLERSPRPAHLYRHILALLPNFISLKYTEVLVGSTDGCTVVELASSSKAGVPEAKPRKALAKGSQCIFEEKERRMLAFLSFKPSIPASGGIFFSNLRFAISNNRSLSDSALRREVVSALPDSGL